MAAALALLSAILYGSADFLGGLAARRASALAACLIAQAAGLCVLAVILPFDDGRLAPVDYAWGALIGVLTAVSVLLLYRALATGTMSVVAPITAVVSAALPVLCGLLLGERPSLLPSLGIVTAGIAIVLVSREDGGPVARVAVPRGVLVTALLASVSIGFLLIAMARVSRSAGLWPLLIARMVSLPLLLACARAQRTPLRVPAGAVKLAFLGGLLDMLSNASYMVAARYGLLSLVAVLVSLYPGATVMLAHLVLGERLQRSQRYGVALALAAAALIAAG